MKLLISIILSLLALSVSAGKPQIVKITAFPDNASIYVNNELAGTGFAEFTRPKKNDVVIIRVECPEYKTVYSKYFGKDARPSLSFKLTQDGFYRSSASSGLVNKYFTVTIDPKYYSVGDDGKVDTSLAWKMIHQIILNYFDEIGTTDFYGGYLQTPWIYKNFAQSEKVFRNRVTVRDISSPTTISFQIKLSSEIAGSSAAKHGEFEEIDRLPKEFEPLLEELQTRIGKMHSL